MKMPIAVINVIMFITTNVGKIEISALNAKELKNGLDFKKYNYIFPKVLKTFYFNLLQYFLFTY